MNSRRTRHNVVTLSFPGAEGCGRRIYFGIMPNLISYSYEKKVSSFSCGSLLPCNTAFGQRRAASAPRSASPPCTGPPLVLMARAAFPTLFSAGIPGARRKGRSFAARMLFSVFFSLFSSSGGRGHAVEQGQIDFKPAGIDLDKAHLYALSESVGDIADYAAQFLPGRASENTECSSMRLFV